MAEQRLIMHRGSCTRPKEQTLGERETDAIWINQYLYISFKKPRLTWRLKRESNSPSTSISLPLQPPTSKMLFIRFNQVLFKQTRSLADRWFKGRIILMASYRSEIWLFSLLHYKTYHLFKPIWYSSVLQWDIFPFLNLLFKNKKDKNIGRTAEKKKQRWESTY